MATGGRIWAGRLVCGALALSAACSTAPCDRVACRGVFNLDIEPRPDMSLPEGVWTVTVKVDDGVYRATCTIAGVASACEPGEWTVEPSEELEASIDFRAAVAASTAATAAPERVFVHASRPGLGPAAVSINLEIDGRPVRDLDYEPEYLRIEDGEHAACRDCYRAHAEVWTVG